jgi:hypothetical protein
MNVATAPAAAHRTRFIVFNSSMADPAAVSQVDNRAERMADRMPNL